MSDLATSGLVYDCNTYEGGWPNTAGWLTAFQEWLRDHGVDPNVTHRVEFHLIDAPFIRAFQVAQDTDGRCYLDPVTCEIAQRPPLDVPITTPAPRPEDFA